MKIHIIQGRYRYFYKRCRGFGFFDSKSKVLIAESCTHKPLEEDAGVPITNYGIAIAKLTGASERIDLSGVLK